jgi:hypothetical protein
VSTRWARIALGALGVLSIVLFVAPAAHGATGVHADVPPLTLDAQTDWVQASAPWFSLTLGVGDDGIPASQLKVSLTFFDRINDFSQLEQDTGSEPQNKVLARVPAIAVSNAASGRVASTCVTVLPDDSATPPGSPPATSGCTANGPTVILGCTPGTGECADIYPVSVALLHDGSTNPVARFTTFLTYQEPTASASAGALRVGWVVPVSGAGAGPEILDLSEHHQVPVTLEVSPRTAADLTHDGHSGSAALHLLSSMSAPGGDQLLAQPYVPINLAAMEASGLGHEVQTQVDEGTDALRSVGLHPSTDTWVDTSSNLTSGDAGDLASGLHAVGASTLVLTDGDLAAGTTDKTVSQPFTLSPARGSAVTTVAANGFLATRFGLGADPVLGAAQLAAGLSFIHFEEPFPEAHRGVVIDPPAGWQPSTAFISTLMASLTDNPILAPTTVTQLVDQVPVSGNDEPASRKLQAGPSAVDGFTKGVANRITLDRQHLASFAGAVAGHPAVLTSLAQTLSATEAKGMSGAQRGAALTAFDRTLTGVLSAVSLATERTVTFTAQSAPIPITVLSSAPYRVKVVLTVQSDKFTFPNGNTRTLELDRPTTPVSVQAHARTSGDGLPVEVTLRTPDGQLLIARTTLTVRSTVISIVGIALTVLALLVLLVWWGRTWRRSRHNKLRAH